VIKWNLIWADKLYALLRQETCTDFCWRFARNCRFWDDSKTDYPCSVLWTKMDFTVTGGGL